MKDMGAWSRLTVEERARYNEEAAALKAARNAEGLSLEMRNQKIHRHFKQIKREVCQSFCISSKCPWSCIKASFALGTTFVC